MNPNHPPRRTGAPTSVGNDIVHVTDTALWVAALRANEAMRVDPAFLDALAGELAGPRGRAIARSFPQASIVAWSVVIRAAAIDELIVDALQTGVDMVVNLGAGLDARPYRMALPPALRWVEVDFPRLIEMKTEALRERIPACTVERIGLDLLDRAARACVLRDLASRSRSTLLIAEGVIPYFSNSDTAALCAELHGITPFHRWILDFDNAGVRSMPRNWARRLQAAPFLLQVADWFKFFEANGWKASKVITSAEESTRLARPYPHAFPSGLLMRLLPREMSRRILELSGAALLVKR